MKRTNKIFGRGKRKRAKRLARQNQAVQALLADFRMETSKTFDSLYQFRLKKRADQVRGIYDSVPEEDKKDMLKPEVLDPVISKSEPPKKLNQNPNQGLGGYIRSS